MMQEAGNWKKNKRWLWIVAALAVLLAVAGIVLALLLPGQQEGPDNETVNAELYWNVDRASYLEAETGMSTRTAAQDGLYHMLFAYKGQQVDHIIADKQLVNFIDSMDVVGLIFDADGIVVDALPADEAATELVEGAFVKSFTEGQLVLNSSQAMNGMPFDLEITEKTGIYDVTGEAEFVGQTGQPEIMAQVTCYADDDGVLTHVYITKNPVDAGIYWRVERMWDAETQKSTREPDENGVYTIQCAHNGELVELKTKSVETVNAIDAHAILQGQFAFVFDEDGYIIDNVDVALAVRGLYYAKDYHITGIDGDSYTLTSLSGTAAGDVKTMTLPSDCQIVQCCQFGCYEKNCGELTDHLNIYDRVNVYTDLEGKPILIFVTRRMVEAELYFNCERMYGGDAVGTMRTKQNGYYVFTMMHEGRIKTVRVKDKALADAIDLPYNRVLGLSLDGDVVTHVYSPGCAVGGSCYGAETPVSNMSGPVVTITSSSGERTWNFVMASDCKVYNAVTGEYGKEIGGTMDVQVGDLVTAVTDYKDELIAIYVNTRPIKGAKVYYNLDRKYSVKDAVTTREPDADGYYVYLMACEGKQVTVKTKSKGMATFIDSQSAPLVGLKVNSSNIITNAYTVSAVLENESKTCNYHYVRDLNTKAGTFGTYYVIDGVRTDPPAVQKLAKNCKIYNVSTTYEKFRGEKATLKNGDNIQAIKDRTTGEITKIFIMQRDPTYGFESYTASCAHCGKVVTWRPYGGTFAAENGHYYACGDFKLNQGSVGKNGDSEVYDIVLDIKGHTLTGNGRLFMVYDKFTLLDSTGGGKVIGGYDTCLTGGTVFVYDGGEFNLLSGTLTLYDKAEEYGKYGGVVYTHPNSVFNMVGGNILGGTSVNGGNVLIGGGIFNFSGGSIDSGSAVLGDDVYISSNGTLNVSGGVLGNVCLSSGEITLTGRPTIAELQIPAGKKLSVDGLKDGASVVINGSGVFTMPLSDPQKYLAYFKPAVAEDSISVVGDALSYYKKPKDFNSVDNSSLRFAPGTTNAYCPVCEKNVEWTALTADAKVSAVNGMHYYLASDLVFNSGDKNVSYLTAPGTGMTACVHLNGYNLTSTVSRVFQGSSGTLNIMGSGTVTGGYKTGSYIYGSTVNINTSVASGTINLIGGTYVASSAATPVVSVSDNGGTIAVYAGAIICGTVDNPAVNIGKASLINANFNVYGGTIEGGMIQMSGAQNDKGNTASVLFAGGKLTSGIQVVDNCNVKLEGSPVISGLNIKKGVRIEVGELSSGAEITVSADGVFTKALSNAEAIKAYFTPARVNAEIQIVDNALSYVQVEKDLNTADNSNLEFTSGTNAMCPVCGHEVTWKALTSSAITLEKEGHYYLPDSITYTDSETPYITAPGLGSVACVHLNGHDITATAHRVFEGNNSTLNIMGEGTVSGSYNENRLFGATVNAAGANGKVNLIGGTYTKNEACNVSSIVLIRNGDVNLYSGAQIVGVNDSGKLTNVQVFNNAFNMYGGKLSGGAGPQIQTNNWSSTATGTVRIYGGEISGNVMIYGSTTAKRGTFVMEGGNLTGYLSLAKGTDAAISGGTINATVAIGSGTTNEVSSLTISGAPAITGAGLTVPEGYKLTLGELSSDASIKLSATGIFTFASDRAVEYTDCFIPAEGYEIVAKDNALTYQQAGTVEEPDEPEDPTDPEDPTEPESELKVDANGYAECPVCKKNVQWTDLNSQTDSRMGHKNDKADYEAGTVHSYHFYLSDDLTYTKNLQFADRYGNLNCLHLNGHSLNTNSRFQIGIGATLNIMGSGSVVSSCDAPVSASNASLLYVYNGGIINLYGGSYSSTNPSAPAAFIPWTATTQINILDGAAVTGGVRADNGTVTISGASVVDSMAVGTSAKLFVKSDWTGSATVSFTEALVDNMVPAANGVCDGIFSGCLTTTQGALITGSAEGRLLCDANPYDDALVLDANGYGDCPVCKKNVQWTDLNSQNDSRMGHKNDKADYEAGTVHSYHFYLSDDLTYTKNLQFADRYGNLNCLHLNGHSLNTNSRFQIGIGATLNIMGSGSVVSSCDAPVSASNASLLYVYNGGIINLYSGSYSSTNPSAPAAFIPWTATTQINIRDGVAVTGGVRADNGTVTISGDCVIDSVNIGKNAKLAVCNDWSGTADVSFAAEYTAGAQIAATDAQCGTLVDGVFTAGGTYTGNLRWKDGKCQPIVAADGKLTITQEHDKDDVIKILGIGNSYTVDSMELLYEVYKAENPNQKVELGMLYYGACALSQHAQFLTNDSPVYTYYDLDPVTGKWVLVKNSTMEDALVDENWDIVVLQQSSADSGRAETYDGYIQTIRDYVGTKLGYTPEFRWNMTWAYAVGYNNTYYVDSSGKFNQKVMYEAILNAVQEKIVPDTGFAGVIPTGTAVQNARITWPTVMESAGRDTATYAISRPDGTHLTNLGRYIAAYTWYSSISGETLDTLALTQIPSDMVIQWGACNYTSEDVAVIVQAIKDAIADPYPAA